MRTLHLLQHALDGAGAAGAVHLDVEFVGVVGHLDGLEIEIGLGVGGAAAFGLLVGWEF